MRDDRQLGGEALDVLGLLVQQLLGDEQGEVDVLVARRLETIVQCLLDVLPDRIAVRLDDHRALGQTVLGHAGLLDDLLVPGGEVVLLFR